MNKDFQSSVKKQGGVVDEIIFFKSGRKKTIENVDTSKIKESDYVQLPIKDKNQTFYVKRDEVEMFEVLGK